MTPNATRRRPATAPRAALGPLLLALLLGSGCGSRPAARPDAPPAVEPPAAPAEAPAPAGDPCADLTVHFDPDSATVRAADRPALLALADCARDEEDVVTVVCHTSGEGTAEYALALGDRLVRAVFDALASRGVMSDQMTGRTHGSSLPLCDEPTPECHERNQRCDIRLAR